MASGINISLVANVRDFIRGTKDASDALDDVIDSLEDVAREGDDTERKVTDAADNIADGFDDAGRAADDASRDVTDAFDKAADKMERSFRDAFDKVEKESNTSTRKIRDDADGWGKGAGDITGEFRDEARSNFSEVVSSFDGSMDSLLDLAQGTVGGLAGSLAGPAGIAAGAIAAVAGGAYAAWRENTEKIRQRVEAMYEDLKESGDEYLSEEYVRQAISDIISGSEDAVVSLDKVQKMAENTGIAQADLIAALAGDAESIETVMSITKDKIAEVGEEIADTKNETDGYADTSKLEETLGMWQELEREIDGTASNTADAKDKVDLYNDATDRAFNGTKAERERKRMERLGEAIGAVEDAADGLDGQEIVLKAILDQAALDNAISDIERRRITLTVDPKLTNHGRSIA